MNAIFLKSIRGIKVLKKLMSNLSRYGLTSQLSQGPFSLLPKYQITLFALTAKKCFAYCISRSVLEILCFPKLDLLPIPNIFRAAEVILSTCKAKAHDVS